MLGNRGFRDSLFVALGALLYPAELEVHVDWWCPPTLGIRETLRYSSGHDWGSEGFRVKASFSV